MRDINLVPVDVVNRRLTRRHLALWAACLAAVLALTGFAFFSYVVRLRTETKAIGSAEQVREHLRSVAEEVKRVGNELNKIVLIRTSRKQVSYARALLDLSRVMDDEMWLTTLDMGRMGGSESAETMAMAGKCKSNSSLGAFVSRLSRTPEFKEVELKFAKEEMEEAPEGEGVSRQRLVTFQVECRLSAEGQ